MNRDKALTARALPFPRWMKWAGLLIGFFLLSDGLRRLFGGGGMTGFFPNLLIGSACVYAAGYDKTIAMSEKGFERRTLFWGRGRTEILPWEDMKEVILLPAAGGTGAIFSTGDRGRRAFFPGAPEDEIRAGVRQYAPALKISGEGRSPLPETGEKN